MKNIILQQRAERDLLSGKRYQPRRVGVPMEDYMASPLIKLVTGPRRAGKSVFALMMLKGRNFAYLNFDDDKLLSQFDEDAVGQALQEVYPDYEYLFLDEIQNLPNWELWVGKLYRRGTNIVITGSNSKLLSSEMATALTGRYLSVNILPFSLPEYLKYRGVETVCETPEQRGNLQNAVSEYIHNGGFAETIMTPSITMSYLNGIYDSVLLKDIVNRYRVRKVSEISNVAMFLLSNFTNPVSTTNMAEELGLASKTTAQKFCGYLEQSFLFFFMPQYNNKLQMMQKAPRKIYMVDNGFIGAKAFQLSQNLGRLLENAVFIHLLHSGLNVEHNLFYYRSRNDKEVDFVVRRDNRVQTLVQVCYDMTSPTTEKREVGAIVECAGELRCTDLMIVTQSERRIIERDGLQIKVLPFSEFAMQ